MEFFKRNVEPKNHTAPKAMEVNAITTTATGEQKRTGAQTSRPRRLFTPLAVSYSDVLKTLIQQNMLAPLAPRPPPDPLPKNDREDEYSAYHKGRGHTTERCFPLKHAIQDLIDAGRIQITAAHDNVMNKPLPALNYKSGHAYLHTYENQAIFSIVRKSLSQF